MTAAERILHLAAWLYDRRTVTAAQIDRTAKCSPRTRKRLLNLLRDYGWTITWDAECAVYRTRRPHMRLAMLRV